MVAPAIRALAARDQRHQARPETASLNPASAVGGIVEATARQRAQQRARAVRTAQHLERRLYDVGSGTLAEMRRDLDDARTRIIARLADSPKDWERQRLDDLYTEVERQMRVWEKKAQERMGTALGAAHEQGAEMPVAMLDAAGVTVGARPTIGTAYVAAAYQSGMDLVTDVTSDTITSIRSVIRQTALAQLTPLDAIKRLGPVVGQGTFASSFHRAEAIVRTEMGRVSQTASYASLSELAKRDTGLMKEWMSAHDRRVRPEHLAAHGQRRQADEPFSVGGEALMYPLDPRASARNTVHCFPGATLVVAPDAELAYRRWYDGELVEITTAAGHQLAGTPNHPVLTDRGWVALGSLQEGDQVLSERRPDGTRVPGEPDIEHVPTAIGEVFRAPAESRDAERVVGADVDFHGDGRDGEVEVVRLDGVLLDRPDAERPQQDGHAILDRMPDAHAGLERESTREAHGPYAPRVAPHAANGVMGSRRQTETFLGRRASHTYVHGLTAASRLDTGREQARSDHRALHPHSGRQRLLRLPGQVATGKLGVPDRQLLEPTSAMALGHERVAGGTVTQEAPFAEDADQSVRVDVVPMSDGLRALPCEVVTDRVLHVRRSRSRGYVYNLQTGSGVYLASSIAVANCRCVSAPYKAEWDDPQPE